MSAEPIPVLFVCTGNSARSIMAEALLNHHGKGRFRAWSAGSHPKGAVHPLALRVLERAGLPTEGLRSKSWDEFAGERAPRLDHVITVCGSAAAEACPRYPGQPATAHWPIDDPAAAEGDEATRLAAFERAFVDIERRVKGFLAASAGAAQQYVAE